MPDQDFNIKVVTTADTSGLKQASDEFQKLRQDSLRGALGPVPEALQSAGPMAATAEASKKITNELEKAGGPSLLLGANLARARNESIILARELASGAPSMRTLGALLGSLGPQIAVVATAGLAIYSAIKQSNEETTKLIGETNALGESLETVAKKWQEVAREATSASDVRKLAGEAIPELEKVHAKVQEIQKTELHWWQNAIEQMRTGMLEMLPYIPASFRSFATPFTDQLNAIKENAAAEEKAFQSEANRDVQKAARAQKNIEDGKLGIQETRDNITRLKAEQDALDKSASDYAQRWNQIGINIKNAEGQLKALESAQKKAEDEAKKSAQPLTKDIQTPKDQFINEQAKAAYSHEVERAAMEQKRREAVATGDTERAKAISETLSKDTFARDQEKERLQRYSALQESIPGGNLGSEGQVKYNQAQSRLAEIYEQERLERGGKPRKRPEDEQILTETGTGGPSLIGAAAERERIQGVEQTRKNSNDALRDRLEELIRLTREQTSLWR